MTRLPIVRAAVAAVGCLAAVALMQTASAEPQARSSSSTTDLANLAQRQTDLLQKFFKGQHVSPSKCGQGQSSQGIDGVFLLPTLSFSPGDRTVTCAINARSVLLDMGGFTITEDDRFDQGSFYLFTPDGPRVPFTRANLEPICDDLISDQTFSALATATLDGDSPITGAVLDSGVFSSRVNRHAVVPGGADLYADSVALGHPGRLGTVFCGAKAKVDLSPGRHTIVLDYGTFAGGPPSTVLTYHITVKR
jgi:hypothetical protein